MASRVFFKKSSVDFTKRWGCSSGRQLSGTDRLASLSVHDAVIVEPYHSATAQNTGGQLSYFRKLFAS